MDLANNSLPAERGTPTSVDSNVDSTQSDSTIRNVEKQTRQSTKETNGLDVGNVIPTSSNHHEQSNGDPLSSFINPDQLETSTRETQLLERVFSLIKGDQEQSGTDEVEVEVEVEVGIGGLSEKKIDEVTESDEKQYKCDRCDLQFARQSSLTWHMQSHGRRSKNARGKKTDLVHSVLHQQSDHTSSTTEEAGPFVCNLCDKVFPSVKGRRVHISHMHKCPAPAKLSAPPKLPAPRKLSAPPKLLAPVHPAPNNPGHASNIFPCSMCQREFVSMKALKVHVSHMHTPREETEIPNENGMFACKFCHKEFETTRAKKMHTSHMHKIVQSNSLIDPPAESDEGPPFACHLCHKTFDSLRAKKIHITHMHKNVMETKSVLANDPSEANEYEMFACGFCKKEFETVKARKIHISHKHRYEELPNTSSSSIGGVSLSEISNEQIAVPCEVCGKEFQTVKAKKIHAHHMHKSDTPIKLSSQKDTNSFICQTGIHSFACTCCGREFSSLVALRVHITHLHTRVEPEPPNENGAFACDLCGKEFSTTRARSIHAAHTHPAKALDGSDGEVLSMDSTAEEGDLFHCGSCNKDFGSARALKIHLALMHKPEKETVTHTIDDGPYFCDVCNKDFESVKARKIHVARAHPADLEDQKAKSTYRRFKIEDFVPNQEQVFPCHLCERTFSCKKGLSRHIGYHNIVQKQSITSDDVNSTVEDACVDHSLPADKTLESTISSENCVSSTPNGDGVNNENTSPVVDTTMDTNDDSSLACALFGCPRCGKEFDTRKAMKVHFSRMHSGDLLFENVDQPQLKVEHQEEDLDAENSAIVHPENTAQPSVDGINTLECNFCHIKFQNVASMHGHIMREHDNERKFTCIFCKKWFNAIASFKSHVSGICGKVRNLNGMFLFSCDECPKTFSHPKSLQRHLRCDHAREGPIEAEVEGIESPPTRTPDKFACATCPKSFSNVKALAGHMSAHSSSHWSASRAKNVAEKASYQCVYCPQTFTNVKSRSAHMKVHVNHSNNQLSSTNRSLDSRTQGFECKVCSQGFVTAKELANHSMQCRLTDDSSRRASETGGKSAEAVRGAIRSNAAAQPYEVATLKENANVVGSVAANKPETVDAVSSNVGSRLRTLLNAPNNVAASKPSPADLTSTTKTTLKEYACLYCTRKFPNLKGISTHSRVHGKNGASTPVYRICNTVVDAAPAKPNIVEEVVIPRESFKCAFCCKLFGNARALAMHMRIHKGPDVVSPANAFLGVDSAAATIAKANEDGLFKCWICSKVFDSTRALSGHLKAHSNKGYKCPDCDKSYGSLKALAGHAKQHKVAQPPDVRIEPVEVRSSVSAGDQNYSIEVDLGGEDEEVFNCQFCSRTFATHRGYARHLWVHADSSCGGGGGGAGASGSGGVVVEKTVVVEEPEDRKPFACRICGAKFSGGRQLGGHMRFHSLAGHTAALQSSFNSWVDTEDLDEVELNEQDQLICDTCDEIFESREELSEHVRSHGGDPLLLAADSTSDGDLFAATVTTSSVNQNLPNGFVACKICDRPFSSKKSLSTHMFKKHNKRKRANGCYSPVRTTTTATSVPWANSTWSGTMAAAARKRSASPALTVDLESEFLLEDPIEVHHSPTRKRVCRSFEPADAGRGAAASRSGTRLAFGLRTNGEIYAQNQPNMAAQFREKTYECLYCEKQFREKYRLLQHVRSHPESVEHTDQELHDYVNLQTREQFVVQNRQGGEERFIFEQHSSAEGYRCSECDETFMEKLQMLIHMSYHMDSKQRNCDDSLLIKADSSLLAPFKCNFCSQRFINKKYRNLHLCKRHRSDILQCGICRKLFICRETLKQHYEQHNQLQHQSTHVTRYQCEYCGMCFQSKVMLKRHTDTDCDMTDVVKSTEMDFDDCEIVENHPYIKQEPMEEEMSVEVRNFEDDDDTDNPLCLNVTTRSMYESFSAEQRTFVEDEKVKLENLTEVRSICCDCCDKRFASESDMRTHETQPQKLLFCCGLCNLYFVDARNAEMHSKIHIVEQEKELHISD